MIVGFLVRALAFGFASYLAGLAAWHFPMEMGVGYRLGLVHPAFCLLAGALVEFARVKFVHARSPGRAEFAGAGVWLALGPAIWFWLGSDLSHAHAVFQQLVGPFVLSGLLVAIRLEFGRKRGATE